MFLPYSFDMRLDILNLLIAKQTRVWGSCFFANGCHCYGCKKQSSDECHCEEKFASKVVFSRRAKLEMLNKLSREAAQNNMYPNTRQLIDGIDKHKTTLITSMIQCDVLEGDGFIIDFTGGHWCGKVVPLAADRQAKREVCLNMRPNPAHPPSPSISSNSVSISSSPHDATHSPTHPSSRATAPLLQVEREVQRDDALERDINERVAKAVGERAAELEARLKISEEAATEREKAQAEAHAQELQAVKDTLQQVQAELNTWKQRAYILAATLALAVIGMVVLLFKVIAAPIVLVVLAVLFVLALVLLRIFFPQVFEAVLRFLLWMWQNPLWGFLILVCFFLLYLFRRKIFNKIFGPAHEGFMKKIFNKVFGPTHADLMAEIKRLNDVIAAKDIQIRDLENIMLAQTPANAGGGVAEQTMLSDTPPQSPGPVTIPAHTPIRDISSP